MTSIKCTICSAATDAYLCTSCADELDKAFGDLPGLLEDVVTATTKHARVYRSSTRRREADEDWKGSDHALRPTPLPIDIDAAGHLTHARNTIVTWARHLAETRGVDVPSTRIPAVNRTVVHAHLLANGQTHIVQETTIMRAERSRALSDLARWFLNHRDSIRLDEAAAEIHDAFLELRDDLARQVDRHPSRIYAGPCDSMVEDVRVTERDGTIYTIRSTAKCDRPLYARFNPWRSRDDEREIECGGWRPDGQGDDGCGATHRVLDRQEWLRAEIDAALVTLDEMSAILPSLFPALPRPPKTVMQAWARQGRLMPIKVTAGGEPRFRGGDLLGLIGAYRPKAYAPRSSRSA